MMRQGLPDFALRARGIGGGAPPTPVGRLDPTGLVPVNRAQPVATDGAEVQRLMERRMGTMPPSSFSGAGAGFVPPGRPPIQSFADRRTELAQAEMATNPGINERPPLSMEARRKAGFAARIGLLGR